MGPEEQDEEGQEQGKDPTGNVVRLPRDWIGPREELVPFGPRAWETDDEAVDAPGIDEAATDSTGHAAAPSAEDFWGEHSAAVQDVLQGPPPLDPELPGSSANRGRGTAPVRRSSRARKVGAVAALVAVASLFVALSFSRLTAGGNGGARPEDRAGALLGRLAARLESAQLMPRVAIVSATPQAQHDPRREAARRDLAKAAPQRASQAGAGSGSLVDVARSGSATESSASYSAPAKVSYTPSPSGSVTSASAPAPATSNRTAAPVTLAGAPASAASSGGSEGGSAAGPTGQGAIVGPASCNC